MPVSVWLCFTYFLVIAAALISLVVVLNDNILIPVVNDFVISDIFCIFCPFHLLFCIMVVIITSHLDVTWPRG